MYCDYAFAVCRADSVTAAKLYPSAAAHSTRPLLMHCKIRKWCYTMSHADIPSYLYQNVCVSVTYLHRYVMASSTEYAVVPDC